MIGYTKESMLFRNALTSILSLKRLCWNAVFLTLRHSLQGRRGIFPPPTRMFPDSPLTSQNIHRLNSGCPLGRIDAAEYAHNKGSAKRNRQTGKGNMNRERKSFKYNQRAQKTHNTAKNSAAQSNKGGFDQKLECNIPSARSYCWRSTGWTTA